MTGQPARTLELREHGTLTAFGGELTIPFGTRFGLRGEGVYKRQQLAEADVTLPDAPAAVLGTATLDGISAYGELWLWLAGDDRMLPVPGLQLPARIDRRYRRAFEDGLMVAVRGEFLKEDLISNQPTLGNPTRATTRVVSGTAGRQLLARWARAHLAQLRGQHVERHVRDDQGPAGAEPARA